MTWLLAGARKRQSPARPAQHHTRCICPLRRESWGFISTICLFAREAASLFLQSLSQGHRRGGEPARPAGPSSQARGLSVQVRRRDPITGVTGSMKSGSCTAMTVMGHQGHGHKTHRPQRESQPHPPGASFLGSNRELLGSLEGLEDVMPIKAAPCTGAAGRPPSLCHRPGPGLRTTSSGPALDSAPPRPPQSARSLSLPGCVLSTASLRSPPGSGSWLPVQVDGKILMGFKLISWE